MRKFRCPYCESINVILEPYEHDVWKIGMNFKIVED